jgi:hypothetical protein
VIRFGLRLSVRGGRESFVRLIIMAVAVALGVGMLLATMSLINALGAQNSRGAWLSTLPAFPNGHPHRALPPASESGTAGAIWWNVSADQFENEVVVRVDVAAVGARPLIPPGISRLPGPGQFYVSSALAALLRSTPANELADRFHGTQVGVIRSSALPSPRDLVIVIGDSTRVLSKVPGAGKITAFSTSSTNGGPDSLGTAGLEIVLGILALVLLFPVLIFIGTATRLSAARREQRFASMRLAGATLRQVAVIAAVEAITAAVAGVALGFALFFVVEPALAHVNFIGQPFGAGELSIHWPDVLIVALGVPLAAAGVARVALRRVRISPLGVARRVTPSPPRIYRVFPLLAGIAELSYFVAVGRPTSSGSQIEAYFLGFFLVMAGLAMSGSWLTMVGSRIMAARTSRVPVLIAGRRLSDNPRGAFRAINGLVLAIFVTSVAVGVVSTLLVDHGSASSGTSASATVTDQFTFGPNNSVPSVSASTLHSLRAIPGVTGFTVVHVAPASMKTDGAVPNINGLGGDLQDGVVACAELAKTPALGRCQVGATYAALGDDIAFVPVTKSVTVAASTTWPRARVSESVQGLPIQVIAVATDGSATAIARAETVLDAAFPLTSATGLFGEVSAQKTQLFNELQSASEVVILASLLIAGCSLAVAMASGVSERKRPFGLLRLTGVPLGVLRRVIALETAVPLIVISVASAALGLVASDLFLRSQLSLTLRLPGPSYYAIVVGGLAGSLLVIASTMPLLDRLTRPEDVRME